MSGPVQPDLARLADDLEVLSSFRDPQAPGWTRRVFSSSDRAGREWVAARMQEAGLSVRTDAAANLIGTLPGTAGDPGAIVTGSHTDTVDGGGRFDGIIGVLGAIEMVRCLRETGTELAHDLVVVDFLGEEPNDFGLSCLGSRAIVGALDDDHLALVGPDGSTLAEAIESAGGRPAASRRRAGAPTCTVMWRCTSNKVRCSSPLVSPSASCRASPASTGCSRTWSVSRTMPAPPRWSSAGTPLRARPR